MFEPGRNPVWRGKCLQDSFRQFIGIVRIDDSSEPSLKHRLAAAIDLARNHRHSAGHGFEEDETEAFALAGKREDVGKPVEIGLLLLSDVAGEADMIAKSQLAHPGREAGLIGAGSGDDVDELGNPRDEPRQAADDFLESLIAVVGRQTAKGLEDLAAGDIESAGELFVAWPDSEFLEMNGIGQERCPRRVDAAERKETLTRHVADRNDMVWAAAAHLHQAARFWSPCVDSIDGEHPGTVGQFRRQPSERRQVHMGAIDQIEAPAAKMLQKRSDVADTPASGAQVELEPFGHLAHGGRNHPRNGDDIHRRFEADERFQQVAIIGRNSAVTAISVGEKDQDAHDFSAVSPVRLSG